MPWTPESFANKHNQKLSGEAATEASRVANALLRQGKPEGQAIRIANAIGDRKLRKRRVAGRGS